MEGRQLFVQLSSYTLYLTSPTVDYGIQDELFVYFASPTKERKKKKVYSVVNETPRVLSNKNINHLHQGVRKVR